jgi:hypothetical protein
MTVFVFNKFNLLIVTKEGTVFNNSINICFLELPIEICNFNNKFYLNNLKGDGYIILGNDITKFSKTAYFEVNRNLLGKQFLKNGVIYESLIDLSSKPIFEIPYSKFSNFNKTDKNTYILLKSLKIIESFDLTNSNQIWSLDISELGYFDHPHEVLRNSVEVQQFIGVYEGVLWVFLRNQVMLGINTSNGELLHKILGMEPKSHQNTDYDVAWSTDTLALLPNTTWHLAESAGIIKGLAHQSYIEIDLKHKPIVAEKPKGMFAGFFASKKVTEVYPTIKRYHFYTQMQSLGLRNIAARHTIIDDEGKNIYFFDETESRWGIYNTNGLSFEYISDQIPVKSQKKETYTRIKEIKQGGSKVYVLDMQQTLHIFEKEKS